MSNASMLLPPNSSVVLAVTGTAGGFEALGPAAGEPRPNRYPGRAGGCFSPATTNPRKPKQLGLRTSVPRAPSWSSLSVTQHSHPPAQLSPNAMFIEDF